MVCHNKTFCFAITLVLGNAVVACSTATRASAEPLVRNVLLAEELQTVAATTAYEAITRLRPEWLRRRGRVSLRDPGAGEIVVYLDGVRYGGPRSLETIRTEIVQQMEYLDASDATTRFGTGHGGGAILVRTR